MENVPSSNRSKLPRVLVIGVVGVIVLLGLILVIRLTGQPATTASTTPPDALANSNDRCVE